MTSYILFKFSIRLLAKHIAYICREWTSVIMPMFNKINDCLRLTNIFGQPLLTIKKQLKITIFYLWIEPWKFLTAYYTHISATTYNPEIIKYASYEVTAQFTAQTFSCFSKQSTVTASHAFLIHLVGEIRSEIVGLSISFTRWDLWS